MDWLSSFSRRSIEPIRRGFTGPLLAVTAEQVGAFGLGLSFTPGTDGWVGGLNRAQRDYLRARGEKWMSAAVEAGHLMKLEMPFPYKAQGAPAPLASIEHERAFPFHAFERSPSGSCAACPVLLNAREREFANHCNAQRLREWGPRYAHPRFGLDGVAEHYMRGSTETTTCYFNPTIGRCFNLLPQSPALRPAFWNDLQGFSSEREDDGSGIDYDAVTRNIDSVKPSNMDEGEYQQARNKAIVNWFYGFWAGTIKAADIYLTLLANEEAIAGTWRSQVITGWADPSQGGDDIFRAMAFDMITDFVANLHDKYTPYLQGVGLAGADCHITDVMGCWDNVAITYSMFHEETGTLDQIYTTYSHAIWTELRSQPNPQMRKRITLY